MVEPRVHYKRLIECIAIVLQALIIVQTIIPGISIYIYYLIFQMLCNFTGKALHREIYNNQ